jgi:16S rRNA pseudouridine516 synthase
VRLDKFLANMGYGSRKEVKKLLKTGAVSINDDVMKDAKIHLDEKKDIVIVNGQEVVFKPFIYLMMNKPQGIISATEDAQDETVVDILELGHARYEPFPVGRLDKDTEGFVLLTNNGKLSHELLSPKKHVPKTYFARIEGCVTNEDIIKFKQGVILDDSYQTKPAELVILESGEISEIELTITEGKFHQVKRMFIAVGKKVIYLKRLSIGPLKLDSELQLGEYRELTEEEIEMLVNR